MMSPPSRRGDPIRIADILGAADRMAATLSRGKERFLSDPDAVDATVRRLEIVGTAAVGVSEAVRRAHPEVPWRKIRGFASFAKHEYWRVNPEQVWAAVEEMPRIRENLAKIRAVPAVTT